METERRRRAVDTQPQVPYIAGKFVGPITLNEFTVGDDNEYGTYTNRKLEDGVKYKAFVRVLIEVRTKIVINIISDRTIGLGGAMVKCACSNDCAIYKDLRSSPAYERWDFSFFQALILPTLLLCASPM